MIKAKITIFDDETGQIYEEDKVICPYRIETANQCLTDLNIESSFIIKEYVFQFGETIMTRKESE